MKRTLESRIKKDLDTKIVLLSGPRQVGKTTLSKALYPASFDYLNMDNPAHVLNLRKYVWKKDADLVVFDELHKVKNWKRFIKGVFDTEGTRPRLLVTGSARLDTFRRGGDSLAGRHYSYRLHPFSVAELKDQMPAEEVLDRILSRGGFPEPFLANQEQTANRWRRSHLERILREDFFGLTLIRDLNGVKTLVELLRSCVGSPVSYDSLSRDLQVSPHTVKNWIGVLESFYVIFSITPYSRNISRSLVKQPKIYFYDTASVQGDLPMRFENAVACALLKHCHFLEDVCGEKAVLHYLRDRNKKEVDFLWTVNEKPAGLAEAKWSSQDVSQLNYFSQKFSKDIKKVLLVKEISKETDIGHIHLAKASRWLQGLEANP